MSKAYKCYEQMPFSICIKIKSKGTQRRATAESASSHCLPSEKLAVLQRKMKLRPPCHIWEHFCFLLQDFSAHSLDQQEKTGAQLKRAGLPDSVDFALMIFTVTWVLQSLKMGNFTVAAMKFIGNCNGFAFSSFDCAKQPIVVNESVRGQEMQEFLMYQSGK